MKYNYKNAIKYLEENGVECDVNTIVGEYVNTMLEAVEDYNGRYDQEDLDEIIEQALEYQEEVGDDEDEE